FIMKCARLLALLLAGLCIAVAASADDGDGSGNIICPSVSPCFNVHPPFMPGFAGRIRDHSRPGSVIVFPLFIRNGGDAEECGEGNLLVNRVCRPRTEFALGATCPTRFTTGDQNVENFPELACIDHEPVRVRFRWVCPGTEPELNCKATGFDFSLTV